ncbi:MAG: NAD(P)/FAD-dependent oxidoreductase [Solirubrobacterales bacterium]
MPADSASDHDVAVVGASIAGCSAAIMFARAGCSVLLIERAPDMSAYKTVCGHFIQASALPVIERIGLLEPMMAAGAVRSRVHMWTRWGWIRPAPDADVVASINLRRMHLDPMLRRLAADEPGVELRLGATLTALDQRSETVELEFSDTASNATSATARLVVGADGSRSTVAKLAGFRERATRNGRFNYAAYFTGPDSPGSPNVAGWFGDPQWAGSFPTDSGLTGYYIMPTKDRLPAFKEDLEGSVRATIAELEDAPPVDQLTLVGKIIGRTDLTGVRRRRSKGRIALIGDAALTSDPLTGVGCGWGLQSAEWLVDSVAPAIAGGRSPRPGLRRYRRKARVSLFPHALMVDLYARGGRFDPGQRLIFSGATRDAKLAAEVHRVATRSANGMRVLRPDYFARVVRAQVRRLTTR